MSDANVFLNNAFTRFFMKWIHQIYITTLSAAGGMYYSIPSITLSGDFEIEVEIFPSTASLQGMFSTAGSTVNFFRLGNINTAPVISVRIGGVEVAISVPSLLPNILQSLRIVRAGTTVSIYLGNSLAGTTTNAAWGASVDLGVIGALGTPQQYFNGIIRNVRIWTGGDRNTGTLARYYPLNESTGATIYDLSGNTQHGNTVNITDNERQLFIQQADGSYVSEDGLTTIPVA